MQTEMQKEGKGHTTFCFSNSNFYFIFCHNLDHLKIDFLHCSISVSVLFYPDIVSAKVIIHKRIHSLYHLMDQRICAVIERPSSLYW